MESIFMGRLDSNADFVLHNGFVTTMDPLVPVAKAISIKNGFILEVGDENNILSQVGKNTQIIDLKGCFVYPGFIDSHMHVLYTAIAKASLQLQECSTKQAIIEKVRTCVQACQKGQWVLGVGWDDHIWPEKNLQASDLDLIAPDNPVVLVRSDTHLLNFCVIKFLNV